MSYPSLSTSVAPPTRPTAIQPPTGIPPQQPHHFPTQTNTKLYAAAVSGGIRGTTTTSASTPIPAEVHAPFLLNSTDPLLALGVQGGLVGSSYLNTFQPSSTVPPPPGMEHQALNHSTAGFQPNTFTLLNDAVSLGVLSPLSGTLPRAEDENILKATMKIQHWFRRKRQAKYNQPANHAAATKFQAAFRGFRARKRTLTSIQAQFATLQSELHAKDAHIAKMTADLRQAMLEQMELAKTVQAFRKQLTEITMPYELRLSSKDKQIEALSHELQNLVGVNNELRQKLGNNQIEMMRLGVRDDAGAKNQYIFALQRETEDLRGQLSDLRTTNEADSIRLSLKDQEIQELRMHMSEAKRTLRSELAGRTNEVEELRVRLSQVGMNNGAESANGSNGVSPMMQIGQVGMRQQQQQHLQQSQPPTAPAAEPEEERVATPANVQSAAVKSIWAPVDSSFSRDSLKSNPDTLYSNASSKSSTPTLENIPTAHGSRVPSTSIIAKSIWAPFDSGMDLQGLIPPQQQAHHAGLADLQMGMVSGQQAQMNMPIG
ncbi:hypothetical protein HK097_003426, partial [Rhizophlyctis rosea]